MRFSIAAAALSILFFATSAEAAAKKGTATLTPTEELKWTDVAGSPGVQTSVVEGDATKGAHHFFLKFPAGLDAPLHHHTADHYGVLLKGTMILTTDGKETRLTPGSYFSFTKKAPHTTKCDVASECVMFIDARKAWDVVMATDTTKKS
jgi:quercetin dioxygenase-like cupin family protein